MRSTHLQSGFRAAKRCRSAGEVCRLGVKSIGESRRIAEAETQKVAFTDANSEKEKTTQSFCNSARNTRGDSKAGKKEKESRRERDAEAEIEKEKAQSDTGKITEQEIALAKTV